YYVPSSNASVLTTIFRMVVNERPVFLDFRLWCLFSNLYTYPSKTQFVLILERKKLLNSFPY
ncbi:MAG TPA: hypothetical protein QGG06_03485, partial [Gammaproteobacteria bacterium]|nr:hypothetical protein [Gammaproteobacteria bacterium]